MTDLKKQYPLIFEKYSKYIRIKVTFFLRPLFIMDDVNHSEWKINLTMLSATLATYTISSNQIFRN